MEQQQNVSNDTPDNIDAEEQEFLGREGISLKTERDFRDAKHWDVLAACYLPRYSLPAWWTKCTVSAMRIWLDRLELCANDILNAGGDRVLADFIETNPTWPLRAWIGLALEIRHSKKN